MERSIIREIHLMPPGRMGYATIKTIEETLRSKAGVMGATRKEIPSRLQRLEAMGLFKRSTRPRGAGEVETGELVADHPTVTALTSGLEKPAAKEPRPARAPRRERGSRLVSGDAEQPAAAGKATAEQATDPTTEEPDSDQPQPEDAAVEPVTAPATSAKPSPVAEAGPEEPAAEPFRWVRGKPAAAAAVNQTEQAVPAEEETPAVKPARKTPVRKPAGTTRRKATTPRSSTRTKKEQATPEGTPTADDAVTAEPAPAEPPPG